MEQYNLVYFKTKKNNLGFKMAGNCYQVAENWWIYVIFYW